MASHGHFHWNELLTRDVERAKRFYQDTIGWSFSAMPMESGNVLACDGRWPAGGRALSAHVTAITMAYPNVGCPISRSMTSMRG